MLIKRILLVDDEECILDTYSLLLAENGYTGSYYQLWE